MGTAGIGARDACNTDVAINDELATCAAGETTIGVDAVTLPSDGVTTAVGAEARTLPSEGGITNLQS